jgi:uncharacterized membrane protein YagU involved in acid resistance
MQDRMVAGGTAGAIGASVQFVFSLGVKALGLAQTIYVDFARSLIMFKDYKGPLAFVMGFVTHVSIGLVFGMVFAYFLSKFTSKYYLLKGLFFGIALWVFLMAFGTASRLPAFTAVPPDSALETLVGSLIYGLVTAYVLSLFDRRTSLL